MSFIQASKTNAAFSQSKDKIRAMIRAEKDRYNSVLKIEAARYKSTLEIEKMIHEHHVAEFEQVIAMLDSRD